MSDQTFVKRGTLCGTLTVTFLSITKDELLKTAVLAAVGALASFLISFLMKWLIKKLSRRKDSQSKAP